MEKDKIIVEYFELLDLLKAKHANLSKSLKKGYFDFTLQRKDFGYDSVTKYQIPTKYELKPKFVVTLGSGKRFCLRERSVRSVQKEELKELNKKKEKEMSTDGDSVLRKRKLEDKSGKGEEDAEKTKEKSKKKGSEMKEGKKKSMYAIEVEKKKKDPAYWFGSTISENIKSAQGNFQKALKTAISLANIQKRMNTLSLQF